MVDAALFSRKTDDWTTPVEFYHKLNSEFSFDDDPCPVGGIDGLTRVWGKRCFVNPPYSNIRGFLEKAMTEMKADNCQIAVFLVPSRTDTRWFHDLVYNKAELRFIKGRLKFGGGSIAHHSQV